MIKPLSFAAARVRSAKHGYFAAPAMLALCMFYSSGALGAEEGSRAGHGHISLIYQFITADSFDSTIGEIFIGPVDTHSYNLEFEYYLNEKITLLAGVPYVRKRYQGPGQHNPLLLDPPRPWIENVDDGDWNTDFQDVHLGVKYLWKSTPIVIEPYAYLGVPSHEYPFFGHAAVGQQLLKLDVGSSFAYRPGLSDAYYRANLGYVFVEETLGVSVSHWLASLEAGYFFGPRLTGRVFMLLKDGRGLSFPDNFPVPRNTELWYQHDRLVKHNYINMGVGLDYAINDQYQVSAAYIEMVHSELVHIVDYAFSLGVSWSF